MNIRIKKTLLTKNQFIASQRMVYNNYLKFWLQRKFCWHAFTDECIRVDKGTVEHFWTFCGTEAISQKVFANNPFKHFWAAYITLMRNFSEIWKIVPLCPIVAISEISARVIFCSFLSWCTKRTSYYKNDSIRLLKWRKSIHAIKDCHWTRLCGTVKHVPLCPAKTVPLCPHTTNITKIIVRQLRKNSGSTVWITNICIYTTNRMMVTWMMSNLLGLVENVKTLVNLHKKFKLRQKQ